MSCVGEREEVVGRVREGRGVSVWECLALTRGGLTGGSSTTCSRGYGGTVALWLPWPLANHTPLPGRGHSTPYNQHANASSLSHTYTRTNQSVTSSITTHGSPRLTQRIEMPPISRPLGMVDGVPAIQSHLLRKNERTNSVLQPCPEQTPRPILVVLVGEQKPMSYTIAFTP